MTQPRRDTERSPRRSGRLRRAVVLAALAVIALGASAGPAAGRTAFDANGMWIWYVSMSSGGSTSAIVAKARAHKIKTVFIKSGDGGHYWSQFKPSRISKLKAAGLSVCAWQYVYGDHPKDEAAAAAKAIDNGADCFVIDAESQYEGKYSQARTYVKRLRARAGSGYPIGLAGFPYTDYHPSFPYSVFLGPGGAQYNVPQAYWKAIGGSVDEILDHTYLWNRPYGRPIYPLGQVYQSPKRSEIFRFRKYARAEGAGGVSWWDWQEASSSSWDAVGDRLGPFHGQVEQGYATLAKGSTGDLVVWAQQHLRGAGLKPAVSGSYGSDTRRAVKSFQSKAGLTVTGKIDTATWFALLQYKPKQSASKSVRAASAGGRNGPPTARLPAKRYEIPPPAARRP